MDKAGLSLSVVIDEGKKELKYEFVATEEDNNKVLIFRTLLLTNLILGCTEILCM